jgi:hypothetical protein
MEESCYICRRTRVDLERLNEEVRTRVYLSYFSNARGQIDEERRKIAFLQRLKDEEGGDPHFRINAKQVFGDPMAYKKLMPWIESLMEIASATPKPVDEHLSIGELVERLLADEHGVTSRMEEGLNEIREAFATGSRSPLTLDAVTCSLPVDWSVHGGVFTWHPSQASDREPLRHSDLPPKTSVDVQIHLCTICQRLAGSLDLVAQAPARIALERSRRGNGVA